MGRTEIAVGLLQVARFLFSTMLGLHEGKALGTRLYTTCNQPILQNPTSNQF